MLYVSVAFLVWRTEDKIFAKLFQKIKSENNNKLTSLVPSTRYEEQGLNLRNFDKLSTFKCNTDRFMNSIFPCMTQMLKNVDD